jgi:hypothetical protein
MTQKYYSAGPETSGIIKKVTVDKDTANLYIKFDASRPNDTTFLDCGVAVIDDQTQTQIAGVYLSTNNGIPTVYTSTIPVNLVSGQVITIRIQSTGAASGSGNAIAVRNVRISTDPIP